MSVKNYIKQPYNFVVRPINDESGSYFHAFVLEFEGCQSTGETFVEAYNNLFEAMEGWIETKLENGFTIPPPLYTDKYSGKFVLRVPKTLHARLAMEAEQEGVSLNQYAVYKLSG